MSDLSFADRVELVRQQCAESDTRTVFRIELNEDQMLDLASGYVPADVKAMLMTMLDWYEEDKRRANRPVKTAKGKRTAQRDTERSESASLLDAVRGSADHPS